MAEHRMNATGKIMISIECENFERAQQAYKSWLGYLLDREPECVEGFNDYVLYVDVDRIFRYIFFDWRLESVLSEFSDQMLDKRAIRQEIRKTVLGNGDQSILPQEYDLIIAIEELSELQKTLTKALRGYMDEMAITEEIADVALGIMRIQEICGISTNDIYKAINVKSERLRNVLKEGRAYK